MGKYKPVKFPPLVTGKQDDWRQKAWADGEYAEGATEPWTAQLVAEFCAARHARVVVELGGFKGLTSLAIAERMSQYGGGSLLVVECDLDRCNHITKRFQDNAKLTAGVLARLEPVDALSAIATLPLKSVDVAFVDDDHTASHVENEINALMPKMVHGGLILMHDVTGSFGLDEVCRRHNGVVIPLPLLHAAGGLGIIVKEDL